MGKSNHGGADLLISHKKDWNPPRTLTKKDCDRYARQILYQELGEQGQEKLKNAKILVVGCGGLGSPAALYLAAAGIGHLRLVDPDPVELSNLNRQILHWEKDIGQKKVLSAAEKLAELNTGISIETVAERLTEQNAAALLRDMDAALDCLDNFEARFTLNQACLESGTPFVHGGINGLKGEVTTIIPRKTPCLRCLFPAPAREKPSVPVFGVTAGVIASLQVMETVKLLAGFGELLAGRMLCMKGSDMRFFIINFRKRPDCEVCGNTLKGPS